MPPKTPSLSVLMARVRYRVTVPDELAGGLPDQAAAFLALDSHPYRREKKGGAQEFDLRHELHNLTVTGTGMELEIGRGKPLEFVAAITGRSLCELGECRIEKREVIFNDPSF